jgi:tRNA 5-methylaminomethyl-2-thiouridine biosynthesis bifunctional protein
LYLKNAGWVCPVDLCNANINKYAGQIQKIFEVSAIKIEQIPNGWIVLDKNNNIIANAPVVIIANSNDASSFTQTQYLPLISVRGQISYVKSDAINCKTVICYDSGYVTPNIEGINYIGATYKKDNTSKESTIADNFINIDNFNKNISCNLSYNSAVDSRTSFRATVIDRRPIVGPVPDKDAFAIDYQDLKYGKVKEYPKGKYLPGLYVSTGYGSRGLSACPIAGEILANMINNEESILEKDILDAINPARFIIKNLKSSHNRTTKII